MLKQKDLEAFRAIGETIGIAADLLAQESQVIARNFSASIDQYILLVERPNEFIKEPDKGAGFVFVGNDTWLPRHLIDARERQQHKMSHAGENGIIWTR